MEMTFFQCILDCVIHMTLILKLVVVISQKLLYAKQKTAKLFCFRYKMVPITHYAFSVVSEYTQQEKMNYA